MNIKSFIKHLAKNKVYTLIIIFGFSVSLMFVILMSTYIQKEYSYDQFHVNKDRIYRLVHDEQSSFAAPSGPLLMDKFPEVEAFTRLCKEDGYANKLNGDKFKIDYLLVDSAFFNMFSFSLLVGDAETALLNSSIVLSESYALKLFGEIPELGTIVEVDDKVSLRVGGVMEDLPENTHFKKVDALIDFPSLSKLWDYPSLLTTYNSNSFGLYVMEKANTNFRARAPEILALFKEVNWMFKRGYTNDVSFELLTDVYFRTSDRPNYGVEQGSLKLLSILSAIVFVILFLSILNYINLTIAQSGSRSKEIAIRKLMGSNKQAIFLQCAYESVFITMFSFSIALFMSFGFESLMNSLFDTQLQLAESLNILAIIKFVGLALLIGVVSGLIPAITISKFDPIAVVKGAFRLKSKTTYSKILIGFQYLIISVLIISALFIGKQTSFMRNYNMGFNKDNILIIDNTIKNSERNAFKSQLEMIPGVEQVCYVAGNPTDGGNNNSFEYNGKQMSFQVFEVDTSYFNMMNIPVNYTGAAYSSDIILLNQTAVKELELPNNPISATVNEKERVVFGVTNDFNFGNLKQEIGPAFFTILDAEDEAWSIMVKVSDKSTFETTQLISEVYDEFTHGLPLEMSFINDSINKWYDTEVRVGRIVKYFTLLTIIISAMGLFAMSLFYIQQKSKEIGVRRVNGANISEILALLNKDFIKWVGIAFVIACPIAYYAMNKWLENFAYKIELSWWIFALAGIIAMGIALLTVSWQSWRAATQNPVETLQCE